ncbi:MAG TPA: TetR/AcrR family transcriptional regulator [Smithellaceae bacterium]|nr:TetR/AcrR family transcriptional regulator [Smithellaceae bacterium]
MKPKSVLSELKEKERQARRAMIIDAAELEFAEKSFDKVSMRTIAKRAGVSPAIIYQHFPDQQTLFVETFRKGTNQVFEKMFSTITESEDGGLDEIVSIYVDYFTHHDQYFRMMMNFFLGGAVDPGLFEKLSVIEREILDHLDLIFRKMKIEGNVRDHSHALFAALTGIVATFRNHPAKNTEQVIQHRHKIARHLASLFKKA